MIYFDSVNHAVALISSSLRWKTNYQKFIGGAMHVMQSAVLLSYVVRPSVCLSVVRL